MENKMLIFCVLLLFLSVNQVYAREGQLWLDLTIGSHHDSDWKHYVLDRNTREIVEIRKNDHNEFNPGLGLSYGINDYVDILGGYVHENSYKNSSIYGGFNLKYPFTFGWIRFEPGIGTALSTGYKNTPAAHITIGEFMPWLLPNITTYFGDRVYARVGYFPDFDGKKDNYEIGDVVTNKNNLQDQHSVMTFQVGVKIF